MRPISIPAEQGAGVGSFRRHLRPVSRQVESHAPPVLLAIVESASDAIQLRPVLELLARRKTLQPRLCLTGAVSGAAAAIAQQFEVACNLELQGLAPAEAFCAVLQEVACVLRDQRPAWVLCCGESNAAVAASQAAALIGVPVAHLNAGAEAIDVSHKSAAHLPSGAVDHQARWCLAPSLAARENLLARGVPPERIVVCGSTKIDALLDLRERVAYRPAEEFADQLGSKLHLQLAYWDEKVVFAVDDHLASPSVARSSQWGSWTELLTRASQAHPEWLFACSGSGTPSARFGTSSNLVLCGPLGYEAFVWALARCDVVLTRSPEVQECAEVMGKPVIAVGLEPSRPRALASEADPNKLQAAIELVLENEGVYQNLSSPRHALEDGLAAERVVGLLLRAPTPVRLVDNLPRKAVRA